VCVVTGAASGIGAQTVRRFRAEGAKVVGVDLRGDSPEADLALACDVADEEAVRGMYERVRSELGRVVVLFNNAGISPPETASVIATDLDVWERVHEVNTRSVFLCCKHGIPHLLESGGGSVINTASVRGRCSAPRRRRSPTRRPRARCSRLSREAGRGVRAPRCARERPLPGPVNTPLLQELSPRTRRRPRGGSSTCRWGRFARGVGDRQRRAHPRSDESSYVNASTFPGRRRHLLRLHTPVVKE
jgi:NAD(P)-dependent dehydrogenase (short-subunit alcohol dehydrogenase family)